MHFDTRATREIAGSYVQTTACGQYGDQHLLTLDPSLVTCRQCQGSHAFAASAGWLHAWAALRKADGTRRGFERACGALRTSLVCRRRSWSSLR